MIGCYLVILISFVISALILTLRFEQRAMAAQASRCPQPHDLPAPLTQRPTVSNTANTIPPSSTPYPLLQRRLATTAPIHPPTPPAAAAPLTPRSVHPHTILLIRNLSLSPNLSPSPHPTATQAKAVTPDAPHTPYRHGQIKAVLIG
jgi:hypothetical protein